MRRAAVIGAGAAGLCAAKHLLQAGLDVTVLELGSRIGGLWVCGNDNGLSPAYQSLHLNSESRVTAYKDFPFPDGTPLYPDHARRSRPTWSPTPATSACCRTSASAPGWRPCVGTARGGA